MREWQRNTFSNKLFNVWWETLSENKEKEVSIIYPTTEKDIYLSLSLSLSLDAGAT